MTAPVKNAPGDVDFETPAKPDKKTVTDVGTEYVILERDDENGLWNETAKVTARTTDAAIRDAVAGDPLGGTFVAIPARSWKPVKVTPQTVTTLKLEEAK